MTKKDPSLFVVLTLPFLILIAVCMIAVGTLVWVYEQAAIDRLILQTTEQSVQRINNHIHHFLSEAQQTNQSLKDILVLRSIGIEDSKQIQQTINHFMLSRPFINTLQVGRADGGYIGAGWEKKGLLVQKKALPETNWVFETSKLNAEGVAQKVLRQDKNYVVTNRPWYTAASQAGRASWSPVYRFFDNGDLGITFSEPMYDANNQNKLVGVLGTAISLTQINDELNKAKFSKHSVLFILDSQDRVIAQTTDNLKTKGVESSANAQNEQNVQATNSSDLMVKAEDSSRSVIQRIHHELDIDTSHSSNLLKKLTFNDPKGSQSYYVYVSSYQSPNQSLDWRVVVATPKSDYVEVIGDIGRNMLVVTLLTMVVAILVGLYLAMRVTNAIKQLKQQIRKTSETEPFIAQKSYKIKELNMLADSFEEISSLLFASKRKLKKTNASLEATVADRTKALRISNENLFELSHKDELTQLANRRKVMQFFKSLWLGFNKGERTDICFLLCDVDYFKCYNDSLGHNAGDECLVSVGKAISKAVRDVDLVSRYGGEEFLVVILGKLSAGQIVANKISQNILDAKISHPNSPISPYVTLSIGVSSLTRLSKSLASRADPAVIFDELVGAADKALYQAKDKGRNQVVLANEIKNV